MSDKKTPVCPHCDRSSGVSPVDFGPDLYECVDCGEFRSGVKVARTQRPRRDLAGVRSGEHNAIVLENVDLETDRDVYESVVVIAISDGGPGASFLFSNPGEARGFLTNCLAALDLID